MNCECCGSTDVTRSLVETKFEYGEGAGSVFLPVKLPVYKCNSCDFEYTDYKAEAIKQEAIYKHLDLMSPMAIKAIREGHNLSQSEFANLTGIGQASIARWELGKVFQNKAMDNYLHLLNLKNNVIQLQSESFDIEVSEIAFEPEFRSLNILGNELINKRAASFEL